ncbi:hypothetical protein EMIT0P100_10502 [Pseudomonas sp. IT-P100]
MPCDTEFRMASLCILYMYKKESDATGGRQELKRLAGERTRLGTDIFQGLLKDAAGGDGHLSII